jgi:o-succinylbenzoate---CoA ligase
VLEELLDGRGSPALPVPHDERETRLLTTSLRVGESIDDDVALVVPTSGTTGVPKGAMLTAAALKASATATHQRLGGPGRWLLALPAHHIAGLAVLVRSMLAGTTPVAVDLSGGFDARALPDAVAALAGGPGRRRYASLVAAQLAKALEWPAAADALASLDAVLLGGGPLPAVVAEGAAAAGIPVVRTYGMSETAGGCVYDGVPLDGVRVRIDSGRIVIGGATLAKGYRTASGNASRPDPFAEPGWFRTEDAGRVDAAGVLTVLGRLDEAISTGGLTVLPQVVETALATHPAVAACAVFGLPDDRLGQRVAAAIVVVPGAAAPGLEELRDQVAASVDRTAAPREVHVVDELPTRGIGKVDRRALTQRFHRG